MCSTYSASFDRLDAVLDEIGAIDPTYRTTGEKQDALLGLSRFLARAEAERMRILATADDIAETTGNRSTATWLATKTRDAHGTVRRHAALATALDQRWVQVADAFAGGMVNLAQTRVIVEARRDQGPMGAAAWECAAGLVPSRLGLPIRRWAGPSRLGRCGRDCGTCRAASRCRSRDAGIQDRGSEGGDALGAASAGAEEDRVLVRMEI